MTTLAKIKIDLWSDTVELARQAIHRRKYATGDLSGKDNIVMTYLAVERQHIPQHPRNILKANNFRCPIKYEDALHKIEHTITSGDRLTPYLSDRNAHRAHRDGLLSHWNIHHFHLGTKLRRPHRKLPRTTLVPRQFVQRTNELLYCWIDWHCVYFIGVFTHDDFDNPMLVEVLHSNWPDLLRPYRVQGVTGDRLSHAQIKELHRKKANIFLAMPDGVTYGLLGGGTASSGINILDVYHTDYLHLRATRDQNFIVNWLPSQLRKIQREHSVDIPSLVVVELCVIDSNLYRIYGSDSFCGPKWGAGLMAMVWTDFEA